MTKDTIINTIYTLIFNNIVFELGDYIVFFDKLTSGVYAIDSHDYMSGKYENYIAIKKVSDFNTLGRIVFANLEDFIACYPESRVEDYINSEHSEAVSKEIQKYIAAYVLLYKSYKSLTTLTESNYVDFIDTFISSCMADGNNHPGTIAYSNMPLHNVLRIRKAVFDMYKKYISDYDIYKSIEYLHNTKNLSDKEFRRIKKRIRETIKIKKKEAAKGTADKSALQPAA